jgi:hypothetical protein
MWVDVGSRGGFAAARSELSMLLDHRSASTDLRDHPVPDNAQIGRAEEVAKSVPGVTSVTNKLSLQAQNF